jgi:hypothetical protein
MKRTVQTIRRTYEQISLDRDKNDFSNCKICGEKLKSVHHQRITAKMCVDCRGYGVAGNPGIRQIHVDLKNKNIKQAEDEMVFEDDPEAEKENDYGRVSKTSSVISSWGLSPLSEIMTETNHHFYKRGSAREGVRYTYKKKKKE